MADAFATKPQSDEYAPYYGRYIDLVPPGSIIATLQQQLAETRGLLARLAEEKAGYRYAPGKWSIKEVIGHVADSERVFAYRALRFARNDATPLPGFEQDGYVTNGKFDRRPLRELGNEYEHVRIASIDLFAPLAEDEWTKRGIANAVEVSVRALAWIIAGHEIHHRNVLQEKYLG